MLSIQTETFGGIVNTGKGMTDINEMDLRKEWVVIWEAMSLLKVTSRLADVEHRLYVWVHKSGATRVSTGRLQLNG